jgi:hypothetical protein
VLFRRILDSVGVQEQGPGVAGADQRQQVFVLHVEIAAVELLDRRRPAGSADVPGRAVDAREHELRRGCGDHLGKAAEVAGLELVAQVE